jgi:two-component system, LytTR family, sensor kinase
MDSTERKPQWPRWLWIAAIFLGVGLFDATQNVVVMRAEGMHHNWTTLFVTLLLSWLPWAVASPIVMRFGRLPWKAISTWFAHLAACAILGLVSTAWMAALERFLNPWANASASGPFVAFWLSKVYNQLLAFVILYGCILLAGYMLDSRERLAFEQTETARLNEQLSKAQLNALRQQIEPHFLFNTLNAVAGLVREKRNDAAVSMIAGLSDFLRRVLEDSNRQQVPLGEELEFLQRYLDIQKIRFAERLQLKINIPRELFAARVPTLILQPIVENAVKHGIAKRAEGGTIEISAARSNGALTLRVSNDGPSLPTGQQLNGAGIGLANVRDRLQGLYGEGFQLTMQNQVPKGVDVSVSFPYTES